MNFLFEYKSFYKDNDIVLIAYWYKDMITPVRIIKRTGNRFLVSHNIKESKIFNAPDEQIKNSDIISIYRE